MFLPQRPKPYNGFLPYSSESMEADADEYLQHIKEKLVRAVSASTIIHPFQFREMSGSVWKRKLFFKTLTLKLVPRQ